MASLRNQITTFAQREDKLLYEVWECFKDLLRLCPHYGLQWWMLVQAFYNEVNQPVRSATYATAGGALTSKIKDEVYNLVEEMALNNYQWSNERSQPRGFEVS